MEHAIQKDYNESVIKIKNSSDSEESKARQMEEAKEMRNHRLHQYKKDAMITNSGKDEDDENLQRGAKRKEIDTGSPTSDPMAVESSLTSTPTTQNPVPNGSSNSPSKSSEDSAEEVVSKGTVAQLNPKTYVSMMPQKQKYRKSKGILQSSSNNNTNKFADPELEIISYVEDPKRKKELIKLYREAKVKELEGRLRSTENPELKQLEAWKAEKERNIDINLAAAINFYWARIAGFPLDTNIREWLDMNKVDKSQVSLFHCTIRHGDGYIAFIDSKSRDDAVDRIKKNLKTFSPEIDAMSVGGRWAIWAGKGGISMAKIKAAVDKIAKDNNYDSTYIQEGTTRDGDAADFFYIRLLRRKDFTHLYERGVIRVDNKAIELRMSLETPENPSLIKLNMRGWDRAMTMGTVRDLIKETFKLDEKDIVAIEHTEGWSSANVFVDFEAAYMLVRESILGNLGKVKFEIFNRDGR